MFARFEHFSGQKEGAMGDALPVRRVALDLRVDGRLGELLDGSGISKRVVQGVLAARYTSMSCDF